MSALKRAFKLTRLEGLWCIVIVMLGVVMYWTAIVVQQQSEIAIRQTQFTIDQNNEIIENQNNNTKLLAELFERQNKLLSNQILLVTKLANATNTIQNASANINGQVREIVNESAEVTTLVQAFRQNFSQALYGNETVSGGEILGSVTEIGDEIRLLRSEIVELIKLALNRTEPNPIL